MCKILLSELGIYLLKIKSFLSKKFSIAIDTLYPGSCHLTTSTVYVNSMMIFKFLKLPLKVSSPHLGYLIAFLIYSILNTKTTSLRS